MLFRTKIKQLLPANMHFRLVSFKHTFTKFKQIHYSQNGEDLVLDSMFPKDYMGFYVDVGAHHPYRISNTYLLHQRKWSGINIDPNPETIDLFKKARPKDININIGIGLQEETLNYHMFSDPAVNTFSTQEAKRWKNKNWIQYLGQTEVPVTTLKSILDKELPKNKQIDVLTIDVEGLDFEVLKSNDWNTYKPKVIVIESLDFKLEEKDKNEIYTFLNSRGYQLEHKVKFSLIFSLKK
jgi:FkbM family methyltransferase